MTRERFFTPRVAFKTLDDLSDWLADKCIADAKAQLHPEQKDKTVFEMCQAERSGSCRIEQQDHYPQRGFRTARSASRAGSATLSIS